MSDPRDQHALPLARRRPLNSVSTKIISFAFLSTFLTALVVSWISIQSTHTYLRGQLEHRFPELLEHSDSALRRWLEERTAELDDHSAVLERAVASRSGAGRRALATALAELVAEGSAFDSASVVGADGRIRALAGPPRRAQAGAALGPPRGSPDLAVSDGGGERIEFARLRLGQSGAWLSCSLRREPLSRVLARSGGDGPGELFLLDPAGAIVARSLPGGPTQGPRSPLARLLAQPPGDIHEYTSEQGEHVLASVLPAEHFGWHLVVEESFDAAFAPVLRVVSRIFFSDLVIILLFSFLAYRITATILRPIEALSDGAQRVSQGEMDVEIPDPHSGDEIGLLTRTFNDMIRKLRRNQSEIEQANAQLTDQYEELLAANEVLAQLSITDGLTKLHNHRYFQDHLTREIKRVSRTREPLCMLMIDLDDFKGLNDRMGHAAGDELLVRIAQIMNECVRESDLLARYGGEEFVVLAPVTGREGGIALGEKIRTAVAETPFILDESLRPVRVTISVGVAVYEGDRRLFFQAADRALYQAKGEGKNCVVAAPA
jgi:diguanylate cyclase (GGDEF)-like protein